MTISEISAKPRRMARTKTLFENMVARFLPGTFKRIQGVLVGREDRADFVREAVEKELKRRERTAAKPKP